MIVQYWIYSSTHNYRHTIIDTKESSQLNDIEYVDFLDALNFDNAAVDNDYINYLDQAI